MVLRSPKNCIYDNNLSIGAMECIDGMYCLEKGNKKKCFAQTPSLRTEKRALCKYSSVLGFAERLKNTTAEELYEKKVAYDE